MDSTGGAAYRIALKLRARRPRAQGGGTADTKAGQRGNASLPYFGAPGSFKRWLGGIIPPRCLHGSRPPREHRAKEGQEHTTHRPDEPQSREEREASNCGRRPAVSRQCEHEAEDKAVKSTRDRGPGPVRSIP